MILLQFFVLLLRGDWACTWSSRVSEKECGDPATGEPIGDSVSNLKAAIAGETHEYTDMYPGMAKTARDEGHDEIADWFETLAKAERSHANRFTKALESIS